MNKLCKTCGIEKHLDEFSKNSKTKDGLQGKCKECNKSYLKQWSIDNPEKLKYSYRNTNLDAKKEYNKKYMQDNKVERSKYIKDWVSNNRERKNAHTRRRRDASVLTAEEMVNMFDVYDNKCFNCGSTEKLSLDHTIPFIMGFRLTLDNCTVLCCSCNSSKKAKHPLDFYNQEQISILINKYGQNIF